MRAPASGAKFQRVEVPVDACDPLAWLAAQPWNIKGYWSDRDGRRAVAAAGELDVLKSDDPKERELLFHLAGARLRGCDPRLRYYGGFRFGDWHTRDAAWRPFGAYRFILPRFELTRRDEGAGLACNFTAQDAGQAAAEAERLVRSCEVPDHPPFSPVARHDDPARGEWGRNVASVLDQIERGELEKVVLARRSVLVFPGPLDPILLMARLQRETPGCFHFCGSHGGRVAFIGASPERLFRRQGRTLVTEALAGTRPRGATDAEDDALSAELIGNRKDLDEHGLVARTIRESLGPLCRDLRASDGPRVLKLRHLQHLHTCIEGELHAWVSDAMLLRSLHPTPAVGGLPREGALEAISRLESFDRGWYAAPVGWIGEDACEFAVAIRCGLVGGDKLCLYAGAGVVRGSSAEDEWRELDVKTRSFLNIFTRT